MFNLFSKRVPPNKVPMRSERGPNVANMTKETPPHRHEKRAPTATPAAAAEVNNVAEGLGAE